MKKLLLSMLCLILLLKVDAQEKEFTSPSYLGKYVYDLLVNSCDVRKTAIFPDSATQVLLKRKRIKTLKTKINDADNEDDRRAYQEEISNIDETLNNERDEIIFAWSRLLYAIKKNKLSNENLSLQKVTYFLECDPNLTPDFIERLDIDLHMEFQKLPFI